MAKWARPAGPARQPVQKRADWVGIFNPSTRCNPARLARQFTGPTHGTVRQPFFFNFLCLKLKIIKK